MLFGKRVPDSSALTAQIKIAIGAGRPLIAWSGSTGAKDADIVADLSMSPTVRRYLEKQIKLGRIKKDDNGTITFPAYLVIIDENQEQTDEYKIELTIVDPNDIAKAVTNGDDEGIVTKYLEAIAQIECNRQDTFRSQIEAQHASFKATVDSVPKIISASVPIITEHLRMTQSAMEADRIRANDATDSVVMLLQKMNKGGDDISLDSVIKAISNLPGAIEAVARLLELLKRYATRGNT